MSKQKGRLASLAVALIIIGCSVGKLFDAPPAKVIDVTPSRVVDSASTGSAADSAALVISTSQRDAPPSWTAHRAANASWLTLADNTGSAPDTLRLTLDPTGLPSGSYRDTIVIVPDDKGVAQLRVPVELRVLPAPNSLTFSRPPTTTAAGATITPAVEVTALDADGHRFTGFSGTITIALGDHPAGAAISGTLSAPASGGIARFADLRLNKAGQYTFTASAPGLAGATSATFDITPGVASQLRFTVEPSSTQPDSTITPPVEVSALDDGGNVATTFTGTITVVIGRDASALHNAQLFGVRTVAAAAGVATFGDLRIDQVGSGYTLTATSGSLRAATSDPFDISVIAPPPPPPPPPSPPPPPPPPPPSAPGTVNDLSVASVTDSSVTLTFTEVDDGAGQPAKYDIRWAIDPISWPSATSVTRGSCRVPVAGTSIGAGRSCSVRGLQPATAYQFQMVAFRGTLDVDAVFGGLSNIASGTTTSGSPPPPPPPATSLLFTQ